MTDSALHLRLRGIAKSYRASARAANVLHRLDLDVRRGEFLVLLGRSGSGKSTLLNLMGGLDYPDAGEVYIDERALFAMSERERTLLRRREIGFVFQAFNLVPTLSVRENVLLPLELNGELGPEAESRAASWLAAVGLEGYGEAFPDELSGGEQQRVAIARALVHGPSLILADEPTGNLDLSTAQKVLDLLDDLCRREGKTLVMATHSREVMGLADRVVSLEDGRVVETAV